MLVVRGVFMVEGRDVGNNLWMQIGYICHICNESTGAVGMYEGNAENILDYLV